MAVDPNPLNRPTFAELAGERAGIPCPDCRASAGWQVYYTRPAVDGIQRVRICRQCGRRVVTIERRQGT